MWPSIPTPPTSRESNSISSAEGPPWPRVARGRTTIYLTELGWGSGSGPSNLYKGLAGQATLLKASFAFALKNKKRYRIGGIDWFSWRDEPAGTGGNCVLCESFGLLGADGSSKPAFGAYVGFTGGQ